VKSAVEHDAAEALGVLCSVGDGNRRAHRRPEQREALEPQPVDDGLEIGNEHVEREVAHLALPAPADSFRAKSKLAARALQLQQATVTAARKALMVKAIGLPSMERSGKTDRSPTSLFNVGVRSPHSELHRCPVDTWSSQVLR